LRTWKKKSKASRPRMTTMVMAHTQRGTFN
jgi:hypothetical protein